MVNADLTFEICRFTPPGTTYSSQNLRASICRLSALKGDQGASSFVAERHLLGTNFFEKDVRRANIFIDLMAPSAQQKELKLKVLELSNKPDAHFEFLLTLSDISSEKLNEGLEYQIKSLISNSVSMPSPPSSLVTRSQLINDRGSCKIKVMFHDFLDRFYLKSKLGLLDEDIALINRMMPSKECLTA